MAKRKSLTDWIREAMSDPDKPGPITMLSLTHMIGNVPKELHTTKFGGNKSWSAEELATMFRGKAEAYSQDLPGTQTFQLLAFYGGKEPEAFMPFTVTPVHEHNGLTTEPPTESGRLQQLMRQGEQVFGQMFRQQQHLNDYTQSMMRMMGGQIIELKNENNQFFSMMKELLMQKALDTHNHRMEEAKYIRESEERKKWISYLPVLANTVTNKEIFPQSTADTTLFETIVDNITPDQMQLLAHVVKPELMGPLAARFQQIQEKKNLDEQNRIKALAARSGDPEDDAAGGKE